MRKGKNVIGKDLLSFLDGVKLNSVKDVVMSNDHSQVLALVAEEGGLFNSPRVVPFEQIVSFGKDAVVISDLSAIVPADHYPEVQDILDLDDKLTGKKVFTEGGDEQGKVSDVFFDEKSGEVLGFELSEGLMQDVSKGTSFLPLEDLVNVGPDVVLIRSEAVDELEAQVGGVQGALRTARENVGEAAGAARSKVDEAVGNLGEASEDAVVGHRAGTEVEANDGGTIVAPGQRITAAHLEHARREGKVSALMAAAGLGAAQEVGSDAGSALSSAGSKAGQATEAAADNAGTLWDQFTRKLADMTDSAGKRLDEEKTKKRLSDIEDAVGRPVTKVILDKQDNVILNLGDIITHEAVQRAHEAEMLDTLLANVYTGEVDFSKEEMRVRQEGEAVVQKASGNAAVIDEMRQDVQQAEQEREQQKQQQRAEADAEREQHAREREQRAQAREAQSDTPNWEPPSATAL